MWKKFLKLTPFVIVSSPLVTIVSCNNTNDSNYESQFTKEERDLKIAIKQSFSAQVLDVEQTAATLQKLTNKLGYIKTQAITFIAIGEYILENKTIPFHHLFNYGPISDFLNNNISNEGSLMTENQKNEWKKIVNSLLEKTDLNEVITMTNQKVKKFIEGKLNYELIGIASITLGENIYKNKKLPTLISNLIEASYNKAFKSGL